MDVLKRIMLEDISSSLLYRYERGRTMGNGRPLLEINALHTAFHMQDNYYDAVDDVSFSLEKFLILFLTFIILTLLKITDHLFCRMPISLDLSDNSP